MRLVGSHLRQRHTARLDITLEAPPRALLLLHACVRLSLQLCHHVHHGSCFSMASALDLGLHGACIHIYPLFSAAGLLDRAQL